MAIFNIDIKDNIQNPVIDTQVKLYYGSSLNYPVDSSELITFEYKLLETKELLLDFETNDKYFLALPDNLKPYDIFNIENLNERLDSNFIIGTEEFPISIEEENKIYKIYKLNIDRSYLDPFRLILKVINK